MTVDPRGAHRRDLIAELQAAGLRKSKSRLALLQAMRRDLPQHFTMEHLRAAVERRRLKASAATLYNCLNDFTRVGLLRRIVLAGGEVYYDIRADGHHHLFIESRGELLDVEPDEVERLADGTIRFPGPPSAGPIDVVVTIKR